MSRFNPIESIKNANKDSIWKWGLIIGAGILGFFANIFDNKIKDRKYELRLDQEVKEQTKRMLEEKNAA